MAGDGMPAIDEGKTKKNEFRDFHEEKEDEKRRLEAEAIVEDHMDAPMVDFFVSGKNSIQENLGSRVFCSQYFGDVWLDSRHCASNPLSAQLESYIEDNVTNEIVQF